MNLELIQFIPKNCKRILEIGCADGSLGEYILHNKICEEFIGLELLEEKAKIATSKLSKVIQGDAEKIDLSTYALGDFDCIIYADSLEHMKNPLAVLTHHLTQLKEDGCVVASIPNVRNLFLIEQLIQGRWIYTDWGLLDRTHFHLFTLTELEILFKQVGLGVDKIKSSFRSGQWFSKMHQPEEINQQFLELYDDLQNNISNNIDQVKTVLAERYSMDNLSDSHVMELFTVQFHLVAKRI
jgi:2-polyprenyl-3-methyl-5-hydroxy-6-metoxy-1,4-benzoquinol methylase